MVWKTKSGNEKSKCSEVQHLTKIVLVDILVNMPLVYSLDLVGEKTKPFYRYSGRILVQNQNTVRQVLAFYFKNSLQKPKNIPCMLSMKMLGLRT